MPSSQHRDPFMDEGLYKWIIKTARQNYHRVKPDLDLDDLIQEGFFCYAKVRSKYPEIFVLKRPTQGDRKWVQKLVETTFNRRIIDLSYKRQLCEEDIISFGTPDEAVAALASAPQQNEVAHFAVMIAQAPEEIRAVLTAIASSSIEELSYFRKRFIARGGSTSVHSFKRQRLRETTNDYLARLAGLDPKSAPDMLTKIRNYFEVSG